MCDSIFECIDGRSEGRRGAKGGGEGGVRRRVARNRRSWNGIGCRGSVQKLQAKVRQGGSRHSGSSRHTDIAVFS